MTGLFGLIGDACWLLWDLVVLNGRKSLWIHQGRRSRPPCQHPSDSGRAGETACDACHHLRNPGRLRVACPLLVSTPKGWRCSVGAAGIRPFWVRAFALYACLMAALYVGGATALFSSLRVIGYPGLVWWDVSWPGRWHNIREAQSRQFLSEVNRHLHEGRFSEAELALSSAVQSDPDNLPASILLAQIWYLQGNVAFAEQTFERLARQFPEESNRLDLVQHDTLAAIGQGRVLAEFALSRTRLDRERYASWVEVMLFGLRLSHSAESFYATRLTDVAGLAPGARRLVAAEVQIEQGKLVEAVAALAQPFDQPWNPTYARLQVQMLIRAGAHREAGPLLNAYGRILGNFDRELLRLEINKGSGDEVSAQADILGLIKASLTPAQLNQLTALLIRHPDRAASDRLHRQFGPAAASLPTDSVAGLWIAAAVADADAATAAWQDELRHRKVDLPIPPSLDFKITELARPGGVPYLINTVQLPRPVVYALALRIQRK